MTERGTLLASGRDADVFAFGPGRVLRQSRRGRSQSEEARVMEHVRAQGFPVPEVFDVSDDGRRLIMERVNGPTMIDAVGAKPWKLRSCGHELASLHDGLHALEAPDWIDAAPGVAGERILHLDLHPLNVIMSPAGPVVIDWTNARRGDPAVDVATTWIVLAGATIPKKGLQAALLSWGRGVFLKAFLSHYSDDDLRAVLPDVVAWKTRDANLSEVEKERIRALL